MSQKFISLDIDLLSLSDRLKLKNTGEKSFIWDPIRRKQIRALPEEIVRQLWIHYLLESHHIGRGRIAVEKQIKVGTMLKRFDLVVYDISPHPWLILECKSPNITIRQEAFSQAAHYNLSLEAPYLIVSNGEEHYACKVDFETRNIQFLDAFPPIMPL